MVENCINNFPVINSLISYLRLNQPKINKQFTHFIFYNICHPDMINL